MTKKFSSKFLFIILISFVISFIFSDKVFAEDLKQIPKFNPSNPIVQEAGLKWITSQQELAIKNKIFELSKSKKVNIAINIVGSTKPEPISAYSVRVADVWKPGDANLNNGLLMTIATKDGDVRIDTGRGLEGDLPDLLVRSVLDEKFKVKAKSGLDNYGAIMDTILEIEHILVPYSKPNYTTPKNKIEKSEDLKNSLDKIPFYSEMSSAAKSLAFILGIIGGVLLLVGVHGEIGECILAGLALPLVGGAGLGLIFLAPIAVAVVAFCISIMVALGIGIGGAAIASGGDFAGGGS